MSQLDILFQAFADYRANTAEDRECGRARASIARSCTGADRLEAASNECEIEDDWIDEIESGLVSIGKAIAEERQFIRSNGEVEDIEKVKSVSRESVEHLARHSNLFTKEREGEDLIPDRLFTVERLTDYAVYENRFLYMLLCDLRDFVSYRYQKIVDLTRTYNGRLSIAKTVDAGNRKLNVEIRLNEERKDDPYLSEQSAVKEKIDRIDGLLKTVLSYLSTPLMEFVAKASRLKPPVTETNVLKMNRNFKGAMRTYHFITSYNRDGFTINQRVVSLHPFEKSVADEFADVAELCSFLTYEHGMRLEDSLREAQEERLRREKLAEDEREKVRLRDLKRRVEETGGGAEEYMLLLERRLRLSEAESLQLTAARSEIETLNAKTESLSASLEEAVRAANERRKENEALAIAHQAETELLTEQWNFRMKAAEGANEAEKNRLTEANASALRAQQATFDKKTEEAAAGFAAALAESERQAAEQIDAWQARAEESERGRETALRESERCAAEAERLERERALFAARLNTLKKECGRFGEEDDFTSRESFEELERQYRVFKGFFKEEWKKTKKKIRGELLRAPATADPSAGDKVSKGDGGDVKKG